LFVDGKGYRNGRANAIYSLWIKGLGEFEAAACGAGLLAVANTQRGPGA
jgi:hypothetical protein